MRTISWVAIIAAIGCAGSTSSSSTSDQTAPPTFSPAPGAYTSSRTVTISSATPGAVIHCTQNGSTPTAESPNCAAPIVVSSTTTLRAIATASGLAPSAMISATYTIGDHDPTLVEALQALSTKRQLFAHQSVGANILYGHGGSGGLDRILDDHPTGGVAIVHEPASISELPRGRWADTAVGVNGDPIGKIDDFDHQVRTRFAGQVDFVAFKLCFADFGESTDVAPIWARYQTVLDALEHDFPGRIIHWTVPLMPDVTDVGGNTARELLSSHIRTKYGPTGRVFDLADLEAHDAGGAPVALGGVRALALDWSADGAFDGHLNDAGAAMVARAYIELMYAVAMRAPP